MAAVRCNDAHEMREFFAKQTSRRAGRDSPSILVFGVRAQHVVVDPAAVAVVPGLGPGALLVGDDLQPYLAHVVWHLGPVLALVRVPPTHDDGHRPRFGNVVVAVDADKGDVVVR